MQKAHMDHSLGHFGTLSSLFIVLTASDIISDNDYGVAATGPPDGGGLCGQLFAELKSDMIHLRACTGSIEISRKGTYVQSYSPKGEPINLKKLEHTVGAVGPVLKGQTVKRLPVGGVVGTGLLRTSTRIRAVTLPMFFGLNQFYFDRDKAVEHFLFATAPVARNLVRHIDIWATKIRYLNLRALKTNFAIESL
ncbi:hypothetical protein AC578_403 [Pseudocercospora eumusae]|uniref:Uncharacterized protein n=1 Tax=Pseudocercospora eumusae TaxID=321146 RepID=A0A139HTZ0_9PEZI|nr:hypothetical protein AC578_403 [Pseudocercospora eumusae]